MQSIRIQPRNIFVGNFEVRTFETSTRPNGFHQMNKKTSLQNYLLSGNIVPMKIQEMDVFYSTNVLNQNFKKQSNFHRDPSSNDGNWNTTEHTSYFRVVFEEKDGETLIRKIGSSHNLDSMNEIKPPSTIFRYNRDQLSSNSFRFIPPSNQIGLQVITATYTINNENALETNYEYGRVSGNQQPEVSEHKSAPASSTPTPQERPVNKDTYCGFKKGFLNKK